MGKTQSTELGGKVNTVSYSPTGTTDTNGGVQMRQPKGSKKTKEKRPMSYPGPVPDSTVHPATGIPVFNRSSHDPMLAGRHSQVFEEVTNPKLESISEVPVSEFPAAYNPAPETFILGTRPMSSSISDASKAANTPEPSTNSKSPTVKAARDSTTQTFRHSNLEKKAFERVVDQLLVVFPKYKDLRSIDVDLLDSNVLGSLRDACVDMLNGYNTIKEYRAEVEVYQRRMETVEELEEQCTAQIQTLKKRDAEIARLKELVTALRSVQPDPGYTSGSDDLEDRTRKSDHSQGNATKLSDDSIDLDDSARFKSRVKEGIYKATPLVIAEGEEGSKAVVKRSSSLKPVGLDHRNAGGYDKHPSVFHHVEPLPPDSDVDEKLKWMERSLERERQENLYLRDRLKSKGIGGTHESIYEVLPRRKGVNQEEMVNRFRFLEEHAVGRLYASIKHHLTQVTDRRRSQFICSVIETSYAMALSSILHITDIIHSLLSDPIKVYNQKIDSPTRTNAPARPVKEQIRIYDASRSRPGQRSKESSQSGDLPDIIVKQMIAFHQQMSDVTDLSSLTENVCDVLRLNFADCVSFALLNQSDFKQFLSDCCRLAWQMAVTTPPLYISTESLRMDDRIHETLMQDQVTNAQVDHYLWPTLFDRRHGNVLYKGRVVLKTTGINM